MDSELELPAVDTTNLRGAVDGAWPVCGCRSWRLLDRVERDAELGWVMAWAWQAYWVRLKLLVHGEHVGVHELGSVARGRGNARSVVDKLCLWADCGAVVLELTPTDGWGADLARLSKFYTSCGFAPNTEPPWRFRWQGTMLRRPISGRGHGMR
ncbi:MAG TPA: hypothetical protein VF062_19850 [Candidatus Limnocylindrales bacterium]